ncbi:MAG TPA: EamA family transporter [Acidimicrobiia bacterium]|nr:EamA family transporter [Acidimicrobiia bacterium]
MTCTPRLSIDAPDRLTLIAAASAIVLGGGNAIGIRFVVRELAPFWAGALRFGLAASIFLLYVAVRRLPLPRGRALAGVILYGVLAFGGAFALGFWGLVRVEAGLAMVILSLVPLMTLFLAAAHGLEKFSWRGLAGALAAVIGFVVIFGLDQRTGTPISVAGVLAIAAAALAISEAGVIIKSFPKVNPAVENGLAMAIGTVVLLALSLLFGETWAMPVEPETTVAFIYLIVAGSLVVFALFLFILSRWTASAASYQFVLTPFITFPAAAWLLGERLSLPMLLGALVVVAGVYVGALHRSELKDEMSPAQCGPDVMVRPNGPSVEVVVGDGR